jgi:outer membrane protein assembly factor BamB
MKSRRKVLKSCVAAGVISMTAGCGQPDDGGDSSPSSLFVATLIPTVMVRLDEAPETWQPLKPVTGDSDINRGWQIKVQPRNLGVWEREYFSPSKVLVSGSVSENSVPNSIRIHLPKQNTRKEISPDGTGTYSTDLVVHQGAEGNYIRADSAGIVEMSVEMPQNTPLSGVSNTRSDDNAEPATFQAQAPPGLGGTAGVIGGYASPISPQERLSNSLKKGYEDLKKLMAGASFVYGLGIGIFQSSGNIALTFVEEITKEAVSSAVDIEGRVATGIIDIALAVTNEGEQLDELHVAEEERIRLAKGSIAIPPTTPEQKNLTSPSKLEQAEIGYDLPDGIQEAGVGFSGPFVNINGERTPRSPLVAKTPRLLVDTVQPATGTDVPMFQYNPANTGAPPNATGPQASVSEQWTSNVGSTYTSPAVVNGTVYVSRSGSNIRNSQLYALSAADGSEQWRFSMGDAASSPAVVDDTLYVGGGSIVYALSAADSSQQWTYQTGGRVVSMPAVINDTVYVGSDDNTVYALSAADGSEQWTYETGADVASSLAVVNGTVYVGSDDNTVYALSATDGSEQWTYETGADVTSSPAVVDDTVYVGSNDNTVYALSAADGSERWTYETVGALESSPAVVDGTVYIGVGGTLSDGGVVALSAADGSEQWVYPTEDGGVFSPLAVVGGTVYFSDYSGDVYALSE